MTEAEWLSADDPGALLECLGPNASARKLRLFAVACCRQFAHPMLGQQCREAIKVAEHYADGFTTDQELFAARYAAVGEWEYLGWATGVWCGLGQPSPAEWVACQDAYEAACESPDWAARLIAGESGGRNGQYASARAGQAFLLREVFGNPFRLVNFLNAWRTGTVLALSRQIYDSGDFSGMPILADALQDAGCDRDDILSHCRGAGPHVRGCWIIDLALGKE